MSSISIEAASSTVTHLAEYFHELKSRADELVRQINPSGRGYFTPTEDEDVRGLLVSYWKARAALLDLITDLRQRDYSDQASYQPSFLIGYAAALVLVDAARWLRDATESRPVVRRKLNEPASSFGIPGGTYDQIQKSLLSSRNAWHLYHAVRYQEQHGDELARVAQEQSLHEVAGIISRLRHQLDVSVRTFSNAKLRTRTDQLLRQAGRSFAVRAIYGIQKLVSEMMADVYVRPSHQPYLPAQIVADLELTLLPGDVIVVRKEYAITNYFLPGFWPHAALYLGTASQLTSLLARHNRTGDLRGDLIADPMGDSRRVIESMKDGVHVRSWQSPLSSDSIVVLRPCLAEEEKDKALARVLQHAGKPYDFDFDFRRSDRLVCTEVIYRAYDGIGPMRFELRSRARRPTLSGSDLIQMAIDRRHLEPIAAYEPTSNSGLVRGDAARDLLVDKQQASSANREA